MPQIQRKLRQEQGFLHAREPLIEGAAVEVIPHEAKSPAVFLPDQLHAQISDGRVTFRQDNIVAAPNGYGVQGKIQEYQGLAQFQQLGNTSCR